jgi:hypothetical protein
VFSRLLDKLETAVTDAAARAVDAESRFAAMLRAHLGVVAQNRDLVVVLHRERPEMEKIEGLRSRDRAGAYFDLFVHAYTLDAEAGKVKPLEPQTAATVTVAAANGLWSYLAEDIPSEDVVEIVYAILCEGFLTTPDRGEDLAYGGPGGLSL